jgi:hypothetical protein
MKLSGGGKTTCGACAATTPARKHLNKGKVSMSTRIRDGVVTVLAATRTIRRVVGKFGVGRLTARLGGPYASALLALIDALNALEALDDYVATIDRRPEPGDGPQNDGDVLPGNFGLMAGSSGTFGGGVSEGPFAP